tara:strand:- start:2989 stop:4266 length:1278 start_codon:yes stop_codon:yes gene_type:complete
MREYKQYEDYIAFQSKKTLDPEKRKKWLGEEWRTKIDGFKKEFKKLDQFITPEKNCLCLGARTGQEVVALKEIGLTKVIGIDIVPHEPHVIKGDIHNLDFEDNTFDFVYTNILDHSINPQKMIQEVERVLKVGGIFFLQIQLGLDQDEYTEFRIKSPVHDIVTLFNMSYCLTVRTINSDINTRNFAGMNVELLFRKDQVLTSMYHDYGNLKTISVPDKYARLWNQINLPIQLKKLDATGITDPELRSNILNNLSKRAYYLTTIAKAYQCSKICEVGTAEGWQFFSFCEYIKKDAPEGIVVSCDPRDVRDINAAREYEEYYKYIQGTSLDIKNSKELGEFDMFYIDGLHDKNTVLQDVFNLSEKQTREKEPVWVFDDFDVRFGCFEDIGNILESSSGFKVWHVGLTASGQPSHQAMIKNRLTFNES